MRSDEVKKGHQRTPHRSLFRATGLKDEDFAKPFIGVANSFIEIIPGHFFLNRVSKIIKEEILKENEMYGDPSDHGGEAGSREIRVEWDADGEGSPPPGSITIHSDSVKDWNRIATEESEEYANQALADMISDETGWLVLDWRWVD